MEMKVVIVESPAKAKTINKYLGKDFKVLASYGHVRDLPAKDGSVRPDEAFAMSWEVDGKAEKRLREITQAVKGADHLYLATDPDREGEAISWHVQEVLRQRRALKGVDVKRVVFNEVTKAAVLDAFRQPREINSELVDAYLARRALDYLVGFTLSPVLWRKLPGSRSAGRVQSVALRLVCERESEIEVFKPQEYWTIEVTFATPAGDEFTARLTHLDGKRLDKFDLNNEAAARAAAERAGVPIVPGSPGEVAGLAAARQIARDIGYPLMIKASAGGGGRGIRVAEDEAALENHLKTAQAEATAAFGHGGLYLERFIRKARHIEVQVLGDGERVVHCFERECSLQRRRQKIWEEAPSPALDAATRDALCASAVRLAESAFYRGAGTLEYLYDDDTGEFFFIEMNTRIQVENPVTEMVTGIDLVREMIQIAQGRGLRLMQRDIALRGHAIEVRLNAEDPERNFLPSPGRITALAWPSGPGVRVDTMLYPGYAVPPYYDSLLAKLIVHAEDRGMALARLQRALGELEIGGVVTTAALHRRLAELPEVRAARFDTGFLERFLAAEAPPLRNNDGRHARRDS